jgi:hypothetical protein
MENISFLPGKPEDACLFIVSIVSLHPNSESELGYLGFLLNALL